MLKYFFTLLFTFCVVLLYAQESEKDTTTTSVRKSFWHGYHEVKADLPCFLFFRAVKIDYEYVFSDKYTIGVSARYGISEPAFLGGDRRHVLGVVRTYPYYEDKDASAGIYNTIHLGYYKGYATKETVAFGTDIGWKYSPKKSLLSFDIYAGIGFTPEHLFTYDNDTATTDDDEIGVIPYFRFGICMGVQLGKRRNL